MNNLRDRNFDPNTVEGEYNLVAMLCKPRAKRFLAGIAAGAFAGILMLIFGMIYCTVKGIDVTAPFKIAGLPILGNAAMAYGSTQAIVVGLTSFFTLTSVLGISYAHVTGINNRKALIGMGITWALFAWVFITNLMMPSFRDYLAASSPRGVMFFAWLVFGFGLTSVSFFDRNPDQG